MLKTANIREIKQVNSQDLYISVYCFVNGYACSLSSLVTTMVTATRHERRLRLQAHITY